MNHPPNDRRNFVHKRLIGAVGGFLTGGVTGAIGGAISGGRKRRSGGQPAAPFTGIIPGNRTITAFAQVPGPCPPGKQRFADGHCHGRARALIHAGGLASGAVPGGAPFTGAPAGNAVMGQFGAALQPFVEDRMVRTCLPGMVLGKDGLCYNRRDLSNKEREYPRGTKPLGTPGEMAALRKAASFGRRMETTVKRMQKIGVLKKPTKARRMITTAAVHHAGG